MRSLASVTALACHLRGLSDEQLENLSHNLNVVDSDDSSPTAPIEHRPVPQNRHERRVAQALAKKKR